MDETAEELLSPGHRQLLSFEAFAALKQMEELIDWAGDAPDLGSRFSLAGFANSRYNRFLSIIAELEKVGLDPEEELQPYVAAQQDCSQALSTKDFPEAMLRLYLETGLRGDFATSIRPNLPEQLAKVITPGQVGIRMMQFSNRVIRRTLQDDPSRVAMFSLFGRRIAGEVVSQWQRVLARDAEVSELITQETTEQGEDLRKLSLLLEKCVHRHQDRMEKLGLTG